MFLNLGGSNDGVINVCVGSWICLTLLEAVLRTLLP